MRYVRPKGARSKETKCPPCLCQAESGGWAPPKSLAFGYANRDPRKREKTSGAAEGRGTQAEDQSVLQYGVRSLYLGRATVKSGEAATRVRLTEGPLSVVSASRAQVAVLEL